MSISFRWQRCELLAAAARIPGLYVPSLYRVTYREDGAVSSVTPLEGAPELVTKRIVQDLNQSYFPVKTIVPSTEIVHDRVMLEVFRRFWWSRGSRPVRIQAIRR